MEDINSNYFYLDAHRKNILVISEDIVFINNMNALDKTKYNILVLKEDVFFTLKDKLNKIDLILFDNELKNLNNFVITYNVMQSFNFKIPVFVLEDELPNDLSIYKDGNVYLISSKSIDIKKLFLSIDLCIYNLAGNKKIEFEDGFTFDISKEILFHNKRIINFTKLERKLLKLLIENINNIISYKEIENIVWKGKKFSIYGLRNVVKKIREKTNNKFIQNYSNKGYIIRSIYEI
jgi:two-component system, OmpR family, response regulator MprA